MKRLIDLTLGDLFKLATGVWLIKLVWRYFIVEVLKK